MIGHQVVWAAEPDGARSFKDRSRFVAQMFIDKTGSATARDRLADGAGGVTDPVVVLEGRDAAEVIE